MKKSADTSNTKTVSKTPTVHAFATGILHTLSDLNEHAGKLAQSINGMVSSTTSERRERQALKAAIGKEQDIDGAAAQAALILCNHIKQRLDVARLPESPISDELEELGILATRYRMFFKIAISGVEYSLQSRKSKGYIWAKPTEKNKSRTTNKKPVVNPAAKPNTGGETFATTGGKGANPDTTSAGRVSERKHDELANQQANQIISGGTGGEVIRNLMGMMDSTERVATARNVLESLTMDEWKEISILLEKAEFVDKKLERAADLAMQAA